MRLNRAAPAHPLKCDCHREHALVRSIYGAVAAMLDDTLLNVFNPHARIGEHLLLRSYDALQRR